MKIYTTIDYIISLILLNLGHVFRFHIKMFHQEASVETIKLIKVNIPVSIIKIYSIVHQFNHKYPLWCWIL